MPDPDVLEIDPGRFRQRIMLQIATPVDNAQPTYVDGPTIWAEVTPIRGDEQTTAQQQFALGSYRVRLRQGPTVRALDRFQWNGRTLEIAAPPMPVDGRTAYLECLCVVKES